MDLKIIFHICICFLSVIYCSCKNNGEITKQLHLADELMDTRPDGAYTLLKQINTKQLSGKQEKAWHALLLSQALDKNYIDISSDSIIRQAVTYYQSSGNLKDRAKCFYYQGVVYDNARQMDTAIASYTQAIHYAEKSESMDILGLAHHAIAHAMYKQKYYKEALQHFYKANEVFKKKGDRKNILYSAVSIAFSLQRLNRIEDAQREYSETLNLAIKQQDTLQISSISRALASLYFENNDVESAKSVLFQSFKKYNSFTYQEYPLLTNIYLREHKLDSATLYATAMLQMENKYSGYHSAGLYALLSMLEEAKKNHQQSLFYLKKAGILSDSLKRIEKNHSVVELEKKYRTGYIQASYDQAKKYNTLLMMSMVLIVLVMSLMSYVVFLKRKVLLKRKEEEIARKNQEIEGYIQMIETIKEENTSIAEKCNVAISQFDQSYHQQLDDLTKEKEELEQKLKNLLLDDSAASVIKTDDYSNLKKQVDQKYHDLETDYQNKIERLRRSMDGRLSVIGKILNITYEYDDERLFKSKIGDLMLTFKQSNQIQNLLSDLIDIASLCDHGLCNCLKHKYCLTEEEVFICCLVSLGFKTTQISIIGAYSEGTLNNKRSAIINKLSPDKQCPRNRLEVLLREIQNGLIAAQ